MYDFSWAGDYVQNYINGLIGSGQFQLGAGDPVPKAGVAAGSQAAAPAKQQDLLGTSSSAQFDTTYSDNKSPSSTTQTAPTSNSGQLQSSYGATAPKSTSQQQTTQTSSSSTPSTTWSVPSAMSTSSSAAAEPKATTTSTTTTTPAASTPGTSSSANWWERSNPTGALPYQGDVNWADVAKYPGLSDAYNSAKATADPNSPISKTKGLTADQTIEDYAKWWYDNLRSSNTTYMPQNWGATTTTPPTGVDAGTGTGGTPGAGNSTGSTSANKMSALNQALSRAKLAVAGRGLKWDDYDDLFNPIYNDIYSAIPDADTNPNAWFDPNMANTILGGEENRLRATNRQGALGLNTRIDPHALDSTIDQILGNNSNNAQQMLDNGLKRGQFNDQGYKAGQTSLQQAQAAARAKLLGMASDIGSGYSDQLKDIQTQALNAASGYQLGDTFDLSPYSSQMQDILGMYQQAGAGQLYNLMGDAPLIDLGDLRMDAGMAQGAVNLNDLDVLDALTKRRNANVVGRGLGSQGAF